MTERELLVDCLKRLNRVGINYMLTGSMASNAWGIPRTTHDLDFVIQLPPSRVHEMVGAFSDAFMIDPEAVQAAYHPPFQFNALDNRSALKVDFWLLQPAPFEREMFHRRIKERVFGEDAWIATPEDIVLHKLFWNRMTPSERQCQDAAGIVAVQRGRLDEAYLRHWAGQLDVLPTLNAILSGEIKLKTT